MPKQTIGELVDANFITVTREQSIADVRADLNYGQTVIVVDDVEAYPLFVLPEEMVTGMEGKTSFGSAQNREWPLPTVTRVDVPLQTVLEAMLVYAGSRWHVAYDGDRITGVVSPQTLFRMADRLLESNNESVLPPALMGYLGGGGEVKGLAQDGRYPYPPGLCFRCEGHGAPHRVQPGAVVKRTAAGIALCPRHEDLRLTSENPCRHVI